MANQIPDDALYAVEEVVHRYPGGASAQEMTELASLHEGNFARYQIRPSEFAVWREVWEAA